MSTSGNRGDRQEAPTGQEGPVQQHEEPTLQKSSRHQPPARVLPYAFSIYGLLLITLTLLKNRLSLGGMWNPEAHQQRSLDLVLFNGFLDPPVWWGPWTNTFGNIALFMPLGFFLYLVLRSSRFPLIEATLFAALGSLGIEVLQWVFAAGYTDVDDLLCNTIGGALGGVIAMKTPRSAAGKLALILAGISATVLLLVAASSF